MAQTESQASTAIVIITGGGTGGQEEPEVLSPAGEYDRGENREISWGPPPDCDTALIQQWKQDYWDGWALFCLGVFMACFSIEFTCLVIDLLQCGELSTMHLVVGLFDLWCAVYVPKWLSRLARCA